MAVCHSGSSSFSKWLNDQMVAVVKLLMAPCARKKRFHRKLTENYYWIGAHENIGMFSKR